MNNNNQKVLEIVPAVGFVNSFVLYRLSRMSHEGFEMHLCCPRDEEIEKKAKEEGFVYYALDLKRLISVWKDINNTIKICKYVRKNQIDCVVGHADKGTLTAAIVGFLTRKKTILFIHGTSFETRKGLSRWVFIAVDWFQSLLSDKNICVSQFLVDLRSEIHIAPRKKQVVPNLGSCCGIDCKNKYNPKLVSESERRELRKALGINEDDFVIGFCGRFTLDKGIDQLVYAFELLENEYKGKIVLLLLGQDDIRDKLPEHVRNVIRNNEKIICPGYISNRIEAYYSVMDLFVLPTRRDGFGLCLIEAAAMGVPVLSSPLTGSRDAMAEKKNGEYINIDAKDIAQKIKYLFENPKLRQEYSKFGVKWVQENFSDDLVCDSIVDIYKNELKL